MTDSERRKVESIATSTTTSVSDIMTHLRLHQRERTAVESIVRTIRAKRA